MSRRLAAVALAMPVLVVALAVPSAQADPPSDVFTAAIAPTHVQPLASSGYAVEIANLGSSAHSANNAHVSVPTGFVVSASSLAATTTPSGSCSAASWVATLDPLTSTIDAVAPGGASSQLCPGGTLTVAFTAGAPSLEGDYVWTTTLFEDSSQFTLQGQQPSVTVDGTPPPPPTITSAPPDPSDSSTATFGFTDDDPAATFACSLDGGAFTACSSPSTYTGLGEGAHAFAVKAIDPAGNESTATSHAWTIDLTPPPPPTITSAPDDPSDSSTATFGFSDVDASATFRCRLDGGSFTACASPATYTGLAEGGHTFRVRAVDPAGNESGVTSFSWTIDLTPPPPPTITAAPPDPSNSAAASFSFTDDDSTAAFRCRLDGAAFTACTSPITYSGLAAGPHTFRVKARDAAGNDSTVVSYTWTIDLTPPPPPTITSAPPSVSASTSATFSFADADPTATLLCRLDNQAFSACTSPVSYGGLAEGSHTFRLKARDPAGNESDVTSYAWIIDLTNPVVTIDPASKPPDPTNHTSASFVFTSNKPGSTFECRLDGAAFSPCSSPQGYSNLADGRHGFGVRATDALGNQGLPTTYEWTVDTVAPATTITSGPPATTSSHAATFEFSSTEEPATFACSLDGAAFAACGSPTSYSDLADGAHVFQVRATDLAGNTDPNPASHSWQVGTPVPPDTTPPGTVLDLRRSVGYRFLRLVWALPGDPDFEHVEVLRSRSAKGAANAVVYEGAATGYTDTRFQNGTYYRYEIRSYDRAGNASAGVQVVVPPSVLLRSPRDGAVVHAPPLLLWAGVPHASYYNVQVYRGSQKVLSAWPAKARQTLRRSWVYQGRSFRLRKGVYRWWVWPAFGPRSKAKYGRLLGTSTFTVR